MKIQRYITIGLIAALLVPAVCSCNKNFLDEELTTSRNTDYFKTNEGVESLAVSLYHYLKFYHGGEFSYAFFNYGTDEYTVGKDDSNAPWNAYDSRLAASVKSVNSNTVGSGTLWDYLYPAINNSNVLIDRVESGVYTGSKSKNILGTAHFFRGLHYYMLVTQYGGVPLRLKPVTEVEFEFTRNTAAEVFAQIEKDLLAAYEELPEAASKTGELTKSAAAHFLAKSYLWRASELNNEWNAKYKDSDLDNVITYSQYVISKHPLAKNYKDLWDYTKPDGPNETLPEIVLASQYTSDTSTWSTGGTIFFYTCSQYSDLPGLIRDVPGGREYNRLRTTYYTIYQYDLVNDSRFWKAFRTKMVANNSKLAGFKHGTDRALMYLVNQPGDDRFEEVRHDVNKGNMINDAELNTPVATTFVFFPKGTTRYDIPMEYPGNNGSSAYYPMVTKYVDGSRNDIKDSHSFRDGIIARSAEDYFLLAEAYIRKGDYKNATSTLNVIRARAAWTKGENREEHVDGGQAWVNSEAKVIADKNLPGVTSYCNRSSYYESNNLPIGSLDSEASDLTITGDISKVNDLPKPDQEIVAKLGLSSEYDVALCFLLNEKSREMSCEFVRWVDLARTKTLISRVKAYNKEGAADIKEMHYLRPIPQGFLDVIKKDGRALTPEEKQAMQNPGY